MAEAELEVAPKVWSDWDGTGVEIVKKRNPRNWRKYPLAGIPAYVDFLQGMIDGGLDLQGVVSRRPNIPQRRRVTTRSIQDVGAEGKIQRVALANNEEGKGLFVARESQTGTVAFIDDKPHKFVPALLAGMKQIARAHTREIDQSYSVYHGPAMHVVVGVVDHARTEEYWERLHGKLVDDADLRTQARAGDTLHTSGIPGYRVDIVQLQPYSVEAGLDFARSVHAYRQASSMA